MLGIKNMIKNKDSDRLHWCVKHQALQECNEKGIESVSKMLGLSEECNNTCISNISVNSKEHVKELKKSRLSFTESVDKQYC